MTTDTSQVSTTSKFDRISPFFSILIPGSGQAAQKKIWRGITIFIFSLVLGYLVFWSYENFEMGKVTVAGKISFSWLLIPLVLFYLWNILDAFLVTRGKKSPLLVAFLSVAVILYVIGWTATEIKLDRLVTRFDAAKTVMKKLANPDFFSTYNGDKVVVCGWSCMWDLADAKIHGEAGPTVFVSENVGRIFGGKGKVTSTIWDVWFGKAKTPGERIQGFQTGKIVETIAIGLMATIFSTILAIPVSFLAAQNIMRRVKYFGMPIYFVTRGILNIIRAVDTVVWGLIIIVWVGLGSFAGVIALTIHSIAALAKLFSEEIEHVDAGPIEAIEATGGDFFQVIRFGVIPQIVPSFLSYTLLRWDINMRSATVIGFVAGGGIGFFVLETIRQGGYQQYAAALWAIAVVIIIVDFISSRWRSQILKDQPPTEIKVPTWKKVRKIVYIILGIAVFIYCWTITEINLKDMFSPGSTFGQLLKDFVSIDLSTDVVNKVATELITTVMQAFMATTFGGILAIPFSFLAAKNLTGKSKFSIWIFYITRAVFNVLRSIEALLYVAIFVFWVGIGPFAGMLALAITTFALMGKLFSEAIENIDPGPIEAVTAAGANKLQAISYAIVPQIVPPFLSYLIYQWDINIRMATIIGFAGGGGIGLMLNTYFGSLQYHKAGTVILAIVIIVALMDFSSAKIRENFV
jgi:phosphonate transport system permease protein